VKAGSIRAALNRLVHEHAEPRKLGAAVGLGVWIGCSPLLGLQTLLAIAAASALRLNRLAVIAGSQVSVAPLTPFVLFADLQIGSLCLRGHWYPTSVAAMRAVQSWRQIVDLLGLLALGGAIGGALLGVATAAVTTFLIREWRRQTPSEIIPQ
jgi:uncharacterized protein (DUF2062 family)